MRRSAYPSASCSERAEQPSRIRENPNTQRTGEKAPRTKNAGENLNMPQTVGLLYIDAAVGVRRSGGRIASSTLPAVRPQKRDSAEHCLTCVHNTRTACFPPTYGCALRAPAEHYETAHWKDCRQAMDMKSCAVWISTAAALTAWLLVLPRSFAWFVALRFARWRPCILAYPESCYGRTSVVSTRASGRATANLVTQNTQRTPTCIAGDDADKRSHHQKPPLLRGVLRKVEKLPLHPLQLLQAPLHRQGRRRRGNRSAGIIRMWFRRFQLSSRRSAGSGRTIHAPGGEGSRDCHGVARQASHSTRCASAAAAAGGVRRSSGLELRALQERTRAQPPTLSCGFLMSSCCRG